MSSSSAMYHRLKITGFIDPKWWRDIQKHPSGLFDCEALGNGRIIFYGVELDGCPYPKGTAVKVKISSDIECISLEEYNFSLQEQTRIRSEQEQRRKDILEEKKVQAAAFYSGYKFPFNYSVSITGHLNGLKEHSGGNGLTRSTVIHLMIMNDFSEGKLKRRNRDKMCLSSGKNYADSNTDTHYSYDSNNLPYLPAVTCKKCLEIIQRWRRT